MTTQKPDKLPEWATTETPVYEPRQNTPNKIEPSDERKANGTLDGLISLGEINFLFNLIYKWLAFINSCENFSNGNGSTVAKDDSHIIIFAIDKLTPTNFFIGYGYKGGSSSAPTINEVASNTLGIGSTLANGTIPITGGDAENISVFCLSKSAS